MRRQGLEGEELIRAIAVLDSGGLLIEGREFKDKAKLEFAWPAPLAASWASRRQAPGDLLSVVEAIRPDGADRHVRRAGRIHRAGDPRMANHVQRPAIFPFSNPTSKSEAIPKDLIEWTERPRPGRDRQSLSPVRYGGRTIRIGQGNNVLIFPGVGLGVLVSEATEVTDSMFTVAAAALVDCINQTELDQRTSIRAVTELRRISALIAEAVVREARDQGLGSALR